MARGEDTAHHPDRKVHRERFAGGEEGRYTASGVPRWVASEVGIPSTETADLSEMMSEYPGGPTPGRYAKFGGTWSRTDEPQEPTSSDYQEMLSGQGRWKD